MRTSLYSILCIVIRIGAVLLAVSTLGSVLSMCLALRNGTAATELIPALVAFVLTLLVAFLLWLYPGPLARMASARSSQQVLESPIRAAQLQWIALSVLGMYFVVDGLVGFAHYEVQQLIVGAIADRERRIGKFVQVALYWLLQMGFGIALTLGARGLTGMLQRIRYGGMPPQAEAPENAARDAAARVRAQS
jgi:hypothetical protein